MKLKLKNLGIANNAADRLATGLLPGGNADTMEAVILSNGEGMDCTTFLQAGERVRYAVITDDDCLNVNLFAYAPNGNLLDRDVLRDSEPIVGFVAPFSGVYMIRVKMVSTRDDAGSRAQLVRL